MIWWGQSQEQWFLGFGDISDNQKIMEIWAWEIGFYDCPVEQNNAISIIGKPYFKYVREDDFKNAKIIFS